MRDRPTADLVVLILATTVGVVFVLGAAALFTAGLVNPDAVGLGDGLRSIVTTCGTLGAVVIGYVAGARKGS